MMINRMCDVWGRNQERFEARNATGGPRDARVRGEATGDDAYAQMPASRGSVTESLTPSELVPCTCWCAVPAVALGLSAWSWDEPFVQEGPRAGGVVVRGAHGDWVRHDDITPRRGRRSFPHCLGLDKQGLIESATPRYMAALRCSPSSYFDE